jgi:putative PIN family toxin of toxin-antitoxin system
MRVLFDTNIFISYLLFPDREGIIQSIIEAGFAESYTLLLPEDLVRELSNKVAQKPYLAKHITKQQTKVFIDALTLIAEVVPSITEPIPTISRDKKDDYLLAYAMVGEADYLVSGDEDLLIVQRVGAVQIISPKAFYQKVMHVVSS